jgi:hypothetical protein
MGSAKKSPVSAAHAASRAMSRVLASVIVLGLVSSSIAFAFVPTANRTMKAIAKVNRASGRTNAIQLTVTMRVGDREAIAVGELISHPTGLARLELRGYGGRIDRYLLSGSELLAAKDGQRLDRPQPMLQPFFLLQPATETTLRAALETFGVQSQWIGLAPCGEQDCFVIGDPRIDASLPPPLPPDDPLAEAASETGASEKEAFDDRLDGPALTLPEDGLIPRIWVDTRDLQVRRIDRKSGVFIVFGPIRSFAKLKVPAWFEIHEPGAQAIRFDVDRAVQVNAVPKAFSRQWLLAPVDPPPGADRTPTAGPDPGLELERAPR